MGTVTKGYIGKEDLKLYDGKTTTFTRKTATGGTDTYNKLDFTGSIDILEVYGDGTTKSDAAISSALSAIGSDNASFFLSPGTWTLENDITIPSNISLVIPNGTTIDGDAGTETLTINGNVDAGLWQIFGDNLTVNGTPLMKTIYPQWFGVTGDGSTDDTDAIQKAINFSSGKILHFTKGIYCTDGISYTTLQYAVLEGEDRENTIFKYTGSGGTLFFLSGTAYCTIRNIGFDGDDAAQYGIHLHDDDGATAGTSQDNLFENIFISNCSDPTGAALILAADTSLQISENTFRDIFMRGCYNGIYIDSNQTIVNTFDRVISKEMEGGIFIEILEGVYNTFNDLHYAGTTTNGIKIISTTNTSGAIFNGLF